MRGARGLDLGPAGEHPAEADRPEHDREGEALAEHLHLLRASGDVAHDHLAQQDALQIGDVGPQRRLLVGAAVDVVEQLAREAPARQLAVVEDRRRGDSEGAIGREAHGVIGAASLRSGRAGAQHHTEARLAAHHLFVGLRRGLERHRLDHRPHAAEHAEVQRVLGVAGGARRVAR